MVTIVTRELGATAKGSPLSNAEGDNNLINLNDGKIEKYTQVKNMSGVTLPALSVVYVTGSNGGNVTVDRASASAELTSSKTFGILVDAISNNSTGRLVKDDYITGIDTSAYAEGAALWLSTTAGAFTTTKVSAPNHLVFLGYVVRSHASAGVILVKIQNGYEISELHDVLIASVAEGDTLVYDATTGVWKNVVASVARTKLDVYSKSETSSVANSKAIAMAIALG
jgi:hypothetical protein